ncbi:hypothetical protein RI103_36640 [Paraburkholderia sp. FT54]|nr:hypothetical protein [Paraburkholderia sp. FT54]WNC94666.1 hypothetical protein RI103_36640 [Paraburkholderia sp. FT54]
MLIKAGLVIHQPYSFESTKVFFTAFLLAREFDARLESRERQSKEWRLA